MVCVFVSCDYQILSCLFKDLITERIAQCATNQERFSLADGLVELNSHNKGSNK